MRKQWFLLAFSMLLMALLVVGCGIPQDQYDAVVTERDSAQTELQSVKAELQSVKTELQSVNTELTASQSKVSELTSNLDGKKAELEATKKELADIKSVYPLRDFASVSELKDWLRANDVSEQPEAANAENWYSQALEIQKDAMEDGYYIWVDIDEIGTNRYVVACVALIGGDLWAWTPDSDEPIQLTWFGKVGR
jgi:septal ring factor EnvC (AmiA/AmiB activator)